MHYAYASPFIFVIKFFEFGNCLRFKCINEVMVGVSGFHFQFKKMKLFMALFLGGSLKGMNIMNKTTQREVLLN